MRPAQAPLVVTIGSPAQHLDPQKVLKSFADEERDRGSADSNKSLNWRSIVEKGTVTRQWLPSGR